MSDTIVNRLLRSHGKMEFLAEDVDPLYEADEDDDDEEASGADEEYAALNDESEESSDPDDLDKDLDIEDDSTAPEQGSPDDPDPTEDNFEDEESSDDLDIPDAMPSSHGGASSPSLPTGEDDVPEEEAPAEEETPDDSEVTEHENPLDNQYAVKFTLGDDISLGYTGKSKDQKTGVIDGYDPEGFYRVRWIDGTTTNGLTDIALEELVKPATKKTDESRCVCGSTHFVIEDNEQICDDCGRKLNESALDALTLADKSRPKGKRMIRSEAHPVSTAVKPNIVEAIRKAMSNDKSFNEDVDSDPFESLKELENEFWTRKEEMQEDIEELGYTVEEINSEYVVVTSPEDEDNAYKIPVGGTSRTMTLDIENAKLI